MGEKHAVLGAFLGPEHPVEGQFCALLVSKCTRRAPVSQVTTLALFDLLSPQMKSILTSCQRTIYFLFYSKTSKSQQTPYSKMPVDVLRLVILIFYESHYHLAS